jgi:hypothetical protein
VKHLYINNPNIEFWLELADIAEPITITQNLEEWLTYPKESRISLHEEVWFAPENADLVRILVQNSSRCLIFMPEMVQDAWCREFDQANVVFYIAGRLNYRKPKLANVRRHYYFFWSTVDFYHSVPTVLTKLDCTLPKPLEFDMLLGRKKRHRDLVWQTIDRGRSIATYFNDDGGQDLSTAGNDYFKWPSEILDAVPIDNTADIVTVNETIVSLSQLVPVDIYNQTAYTLVCESQFENRWSFFTEKIIKPMLAQRVFVVCSGRYFLRNLREWGFKTFDGIVDESYDKEYELGRRVDMIASSMQKLAQQNQHEVYKQARTILEHNYNMLMSTPWLQLMANDVGATITGQNNKINK